MVRQGCRDGLGLGWDMGLLVGPAWKLVTSPAVESLGQVLTAPWLTWGPGLWAGLGGVPRELGKTDKAYTRF